MFIELVKVKSDLTTWGYIWEWELHEGIQGEASTTLGPWLSDYLKEITDGLYVQEVNE